jgi:hypothetical protein
MNVWHVSNTNTSLSDLISDDFSNVSVKSAEPIVSYKIKCTPYLFEVRIQKDELNECDRISVGGKKICVQFSVYWDKDESKYPQLDGVSYNENCSLDEDFKLEKKHGTIRMLKASLKFLVSTYPDIEGVVFKDSSMMKCMNDIKISLTDFYIAKHGNTWYCEKFSAEPFQNEEYKTNLAELNNNLTALKTMPFEEFYATYFVINKIKLKKSYKLVKEVYKNSKTYRDFISVLHERNGDCAVFKTWLTYFISKVGGAKLNLHNAFFVIRRDVIDGWRDVVSVVNVV